MHLAFHELGHLIAGTLVRFKLFSYKIGPFSNKAFKTDGLLAR